MKTSAFYADITAQETTQVSELEQVIELDWILQGNLLLIPSPMASWLQNGRSDDDVRGMGIFFVGSNTAVRRNVFLPFYETPGEEEEQVEEGKVGGNGENAWKNKEKQ